MQDGVLAYVGIGSNLGDPLQNCKDAIRHLSGISGVKLERTSSFYKTEPVIVSAQDGGRKRELEMQQWFINAAVEIRTILSAPNLLGFLQHIESEMGRVRTYAGAPRFIDLDLLLYGQEIIETEDLVVPHPQMHERRFVLEPLCEIASYAIHPVFGLSLRGLKERLNDQKVVERYAQ